jgi:hypothetical protein
MFSPMVVAEVQFYDVVVWLHVTAVVLAFGPTFGFGLYNATTGRNHPRSLPAVLEAQNLVMRTMTTIGALVVLGSGIYLAADRWDFGYAFVVAGLVAIALLLGLIYGVFIPNGRRVAQLAERDIEASGSGDVNFSDEFWRTAAVSRRLGPVAGIIVILAIYFMVAKPFL